MSELQFSEYWWVYLERNSEWDREQAEYQQFMKGHFAFIDDEEKNKVNNLYQ